MYKRGIIVLAALILISAIVYAVPTITVEATYLYEGQEAWFNLSVNNFGNTQTLTQVDADVPGFNITEVRTFTDWNYTISNNHITWYDGVIGTNIIQAMFQFKARAPIVNQNETHDWETETGNTTIIIPIDLINDETGPILSNPIPANGTYVKQGSTTQPISIDAVDPETGISQSVFRYDYCTDTYNYTIILTCNNGVCESTMDTTLLTEGQFICYKFEVENNAGETSEFIGKFGLDGTPPQVTLITPADNAFVPDNVNFAFKAEDNLASNLDCNLSLDNIAIYNANVLNGEIQTTTINISNYAEGSYPWHATCTDLADWETQSATRTLFIDRTPPTITLIEPADGSIIAPGTEIVLNITDNYNIDQTRYSQSINTSTWAEGPNVITIYANDSAGNNAQETFNFIIDSTPPIITLIAPTQNASIDAHVNFTYSAVDNYAAQSNCSLFIDWNVVDNRLAHNITIIPEILNLGQYQWLVRCEDSVGNWDISETRDLNIIDLSPPDITIEPITYIKRGDTLTVSAQVTDPSNVSTVTADINGNNIILTKDNNRYYGYYQTNLNTTLGTKTITYTADDTLSNSATATEDFEVIVNYIFTTSLSPNPATPSTSIDLTGTIVIDDGSNIPENIATIYLPDNTTTTSINASGYFEHSFTAPNTDGTYDITVSVTTSNNITYNSTETLTITTPGGSTSSASSDEGSPGGGSGGGTYCGDDLCGYKESCSTCPDDCGPCVKTETSILIPEPEPVIEVIEEEPEEEEETPEAEDRTPIGVGSAVGWFGNLGTVSSIAAMILLVVILTMAFAGNKKDKFGWDEYFKKKR